MPALPRLIPAASTPPADAHVDDDDDRRLLRRICRRELAAFEALYRRYHPRLARFARRMLRPEHLVDEVLNDTLHVVWNQPERFNGTSKVSTWIFAIAYRKALKAMDRHDEPVEDGDEPPIADHEQPESLLGRVQVRAAIDRALLALSADQRVAVALTYFHGFSHLEIAQIVDCPADTVKTRVFHARKRLRAALAGRLEDWL